MEGYLNLFDNVSFKVKVIYTLLYFVQKAKIESSGTFKVLMTAGVVDHMRSSSADANKIFTHSFV